MPVQPLRSLVTVLLAVPVVLSFLLMAAHLMRGWGTAPAVLVLLPLALLLVRRWWAARVLQVLLVLFALEWVRTAMMLAEIRLALGEAWMRMVIIIGAVAIFTAVSSWSLETRPLRRWFRREPSGPPGFELR
jgi:hypothetical protein